MNEVYPSTDKSFLDVLRRFVRRLVKEKHIDRTIQNSVSGSDDGAVYSYRTKLAPSSVASCAATLAVSGTRNTSRGSRSRKSSHRMFPDAYISEGKPVTREEFALRVRKRLLTVAKDREAMTLKARDLLRQRGNSYDKIMAAQWYNLPEACKYLQTLPEQAQNAASTVSQTSSSLHPPSNHHPLSPLEVQSSPGSNLEDSTCGGHSQIPHGTPAGRSQTPQQGHVNGREMEDWQQVSGQRNGGCMSSDSGEEVKTNRPSNVLLYTYLLQQKFLSSHLPERERTAQAAAIALISNLPQPDSLSPVPSRCHRRDDSRECVSTGEDSVSVTSQSTSSDLFIPRRFQQHVAGDPDEQQHHSQRHPIYIPKSGRTPSPLSDEQHRHTQQRAVPPSRGDTLIMYTLDDLPTPFAKRLSETDITLKDFKEKVFARKGEYRFFFTHFCEAIGMDIYEEFSEEPSVLPLVEGKIVGRVETVLSE